MTGLISLALVLSSTASGGGFKQTRFSLGSETLPRFCVPAQAKMKKKDRAAVAQVIELIEAKRFDEALERVAPLDSESPSVMALKAGVFLLSSRSEEAKELLDQALGKRSDDLCLRQNRVLLGVAAGENGAFDALERLVLAAPEDPDVLFLLAFAHLYQSEMDKAAMVLTRARSLYPANPHLQIMYGTVAILSGMMREGVEALEAAIALDPTVAEELNAMLLPAYLESGATASYIKLASQMGNPLGDDGTLATSKQPESDYYSLIGAEKGLSFVSTIHTSAGDLTCELFPKEAPVTVANFVGLATGTIAWTDPATGEAKTGPLYPGTRFHRVIPNFMVQAGDPLGTGSGGPGYVFVDEISPRLQFDRPGVLAMANSGPRTNGSQWFITEVPTPHLTGKHTIFGQCDVETVELVTSIAGSPRGENDAPTVPVIIESIDFKTVRPR